MPGKPSKPFNMLVDKRPQRARIGAVLAQSDVGSPPPVVVPPMPEGLEPEAADVWTAFWASPLSQLIVPTEHHLVQRYCYLLSERLKIEAKEPLSKDDQSMLRLRTNEILTLGERLGFGLLPRMRLGIAVGGAEKSMSAMHQRHEKPQQPVRIVVEE